MLQISGLEVLPFLSYQEKTKGLKTKDRKIRGNCNLSTNVKFHEFE